MENVFEHRIAKSYVQINKLVPRRYGAPKVHKQDAPLRPIIAFSFASTEIISRKMAEKYKEITNFEAKYGITLVRHLEKQDINVDCI